MTGRDSVVRVPVEAVPATLVAVLAMILATAGAVVLVQRGAPPTEPSATTVAAVAVDELVRFDATPPTPAQLPPLDAERDVPEPPSDGDVPEPPEVEQDAPELDPTLVAAELDEHATPRPGDVEGRMVASPLPLLDLDGLAATAARTGVPRRALAAYASAALRLREEQPSCNLTWITLAGIGYVESHHGTIGGRQLLADGTVSSPIIGVALVGGPNVRAIPDTDGGALDGDTRWDRAVGPMQFIPSTWARWGTDGNGDGVADPQHIDDAALAAARYLCASGRDLTESSSWGQAMWSYNRSDDYIRTVLSVANTYADRANAD